LEEVYYGGKGPHWAVVPMMKKKKILTIGYKSSSCGNNKISFIKTEEI